MNEHDSPPADVREALIGELHPDYPTPIPALNQLYEDHADRFLSRFELRPRGTVPAPQISDPNTIPDDVADKSQLAFHEFVWGAENWPTKRELGISRQAWKCAIAVAIEKMNERS